MLYTFVSEEMFWDKYPDRQITEDPFTLNECICFELKDFFLYVPEIFWDTWYLCSVMWYSDSDKDTFYNCELGCARNITGCEVYKLLKKEFGIKELIHKDYLSDAIRAFSSNTIIEELLKSGELPPEKLSEVLQDMVYVQNYNYLIPDMVSMGMVPSDLRKLIFVAAKINNICFIKNFVNLMMVNPDDIIFVWDELNALPCP